MYEAELSLCAFTSPLNNALRACVTAQHAAGMLGPRDLSWLILAGNVMQLSRLKRKSLNQDRPEQTYL